MTRSTTPVVRVSSQAWQHAWAVLNAVPADIPLPQIVIDDVDELSLDWDEARDRVLSLTITDAGCVGISGIIGTEHISESIAVDGWCQDLTFIRAVLQRLYP
ncbi:MAG: hypothetical protein ABMA15_15555 [Vicinamibacterales bacterium]